MRDTFNLDKRKKYIEKSIFSRQLYLYVCKRYLRNFFCKGNNGEKKENCTNIKHSTTHRGKDNAGKTTKLHFQATYYQHIFNETGKGTV